MASVYKYTIIYFTLTIYESMSYSIQRNLCLETVARFVNHEHKCNFYFSTANDALQDVDTCPNKCHYWMDNLIYYTNSLRRIGLTIGNDNKMFYPCSRSYIDRYLNINCSSWNAREYITWNDVYACSINDAQCVRIKNYCICHCMPGYILVDDKCLKKTVPVGGFCSLHQQCTGSNNSGICENKRCTCAEGFTFIDFACKKKHLELYDLCEVTEQCIQPFSVCFQGKCKCIDGFSAFDTYSCLKDAVPVGGFCNFSKQCTGSNDSGICEYGRCTCAKGFTIIDFACKKKNLELNESCELSEQCIQPFSVCFQGKCKCINGYSAFDSDSCIKDTVPVGGFCNLSKQCTGSNNSGICKNGRCTCAKEFTFIDLGCDKNHPNSFGIGSSNSQQDDTNIGVTLGALFGGFILGVIVTAVITTLMYRRLKFRTRKRKEPDVMFVENRKYAAASSAQICFTNNKKQNVAKLSSYSFANETQGYNLSRRQENERTEDVYNHLHEQTEQDDDTYDHACAAPNNSTDLSDYSNIRDTATVKPTSPSEDGDDYSTLKR